MRPTSIKPGECCAGCAADVARVTTEMGGKPFDWTVEVSVDGLAGDVTIVEYEVPFYFRAMRLIAVDSRDGKATEIAAIHVDGKPQFASGREPVKTLAFAPNGLDCGIMFDGQPVGARASMVVHFVEDSAFTALLIGRARAE